MNCCGKKCINLLTLIIAVIIFVQTNFITIMVFSLKNNGVQAKTNVTEENISYEETKVPIQGNTFVILDENNEILKDNLTTNNEGKINLVLSKGKYYLKQINTIEGYNLNKSLIEININDEENINIKVQSTKPTTEEVTTVNKEIINETNETNLHNVNNFINTINRKNIVNLTKENTYKNKIQEEYIQNKVLQGENLTLSMTRQDYINYIDMIMLNSTKIPILPVASR